MHDDLIDAVDYIVGQGWADRKRVAIYGGSYGGYAALVGRRVHAGRVLLRRRHRRAVQPQDAAGDHPAVLGADDRPALQAGRQPGDRGGLPLVPLAAVAGARHPDSAAHRAGRQRPAGQAGRVGADRRRAQEAGIDHEYMLFPDEGHGFAKPENRLKFYAAAERFLARYLGGRFEE